MAEPFGFSTVTTVQRLNVIYILHLTLWDQLVAQDHKSTLLTKCLNTSKCHGTYIVTHACDHFKNLFKFQSLPLTTTFTPTMLTMAHIFMFS